MGALSRAAACEATASAVAALAAGCSAAGVLTSRSHASSAPTHTSVASASQHTSMRLPPGDTERTVPRQWLPLRSTRTRAPARPSRLEASTTSSSDSVAKHSVAIPSSRSVGRNQLNHANTIWSSFEGDGRQREVVSCLFLTFVSTCDGTRSKAEAEAHQTPRIQRRSRTKSASLPL